MWKMPAVPNERKENMQLGVSLSEYEIRDLIKEKVSKLTGVIPEDLEVYVTCWNGRLSTCTTHVDGETNMTLLREI